ncbi:MAG: hypothetical protein RL653_3580 [Pseudomonadota bacterium]|jgi:branched-chain amino acid transport system substrate-binding protein
MMRSLHVAALSGLLLSGCSFTVASDKAFRECEVDAECPGSQACVQNFCVGLRVPEGCGDLIGDTPTEQTLHLAAVLPLSRADGDGGVVQDPKENARLNSLRLALDEINDRRISSRPVALHLCDSGGNADKAKQQAEWLIQDKAAVAILTAGSSQTLAVAEAAIPARTVTLSFSATSPELTTRLAVTDGSSRLLWRTAPSDAIQGKVMSNLVLNDTRYASVKKVGILYLADPYGQGLNNQVITGLEGSSRESKGFEYPRGGNITTAVDQLNAWDPDLTVLIAFPDDAVRLLKAAFAKANLKKSAGHQWLFSDSAKSVSMLEGLSDTERTEVEDAYGSAPAQGAGRAFSAFRDAYQSRYGASPSDYSYTAHAYDAAYCLSLALAAAVGDGTGSVNGGTVAAGLTRLTGGTPFPLQAIKFAEAAQVVASGTRLDVDGASGALDFNNATGEAPGKIEIWKVAGKGFSSVKVVDP